MRVEDMDEGEVGESAQNVVEERHGVKDLIPLFSTGQKSRFCNYDFAGGR